MMKVFITRTIAYLFFVFASIGLISIFYSIETENKIKKWKLPEDVTIVFMGDSHVELSVDDVQMEKTKNLGHASEIYYFTYYKLQYLLENNSTIKTVYLGYNYHNLSSSTDELLNEDVINITPDYFFILPFKDKFRILLKAFDNLPSYARTVVKRNKDFSFVGGFNNTYTAGKALKEKIDERIKSQFFAENKRLNLSEINKQYLFKIIKLCEEKQIGLVFLQTPLHSYYLTKVPNYYIEQYSNLLKEMKLKHIDMSQIRMQDDCYLPDGDHVSLKGVGVFLPELSKKIYEN